MKPTRVLTALALCLLAAACSRPVPKMEPKSRERVEPWNTELVASISQLPLQHNGRVMPFGTLAAFTLYLVHGRRDLQFAWADKAEEKIVLSPTEWLLDVWFHPDQAADYGLFRIENRELLDAIGLERDGPQRLDFDYISYRQLLAHAGRLQQVAKVAGSKDMLERSQIERQELELMGKLRAYHALHQFLEPLHASFTVTGTDFQRLYGGAKEVLFAELLAQGKALAELARTAPATGNDPASGNVGQVGDMLAAMAEEPGSDVPAMFPPVGDRATDKWLTLAELTGSALQGQLAPQHLVMLRSLQAAVAAADAGAQSTALQQFRRAVVTVAELRGENAGVVLESKYYAWSLHYRSLHLGFLPAFMLVVLGWLLPRRQWIWRLAFWFTAAGLALLVGDVVLRCVVRSRPPITGLYDTFLFIASVGVLAALLIELMNRRRIALSVAPILGALLVMLGRAFEVYDGKDTMAPLQAVLDSNYWLATHVVVINSGYAAGMLGALLGSTWLLLHAFGLRRGDVDFHKGIVRMTYGATCFGLTFAVVGTILGGVWANDSWGRFWGWDTKENGALLICLSQIALLHARMSGLVRDFGYCLWAGFTGMVVAFSWFHVNLLQVGLHAYGFSDHTAFGVFSYYAAQTLVLLIGVVGHLLQVSRPVSAAPAARDAPQVADLAPAK